MLVVLGILVVLGMLVAVRIGPLDSLCVIAAVRSKRGPPRVRGQNMF